VEITQEHIELAERAAQKFCAYRPWVDEDALLGAALESLVKSARDFNGKGQFSTWAVQKMYYAMFDELRNLSFLSRADQRAVKRGDKIIHGQKNKREIAPPVLISLEQPVAENLSVGDMLDSNEGGYEQVETSIVLSAILADATPRERLVTLARQRGFTQAEIGSWLGVSEARVSQIQRAVGERLVKRLAV
jgi:RNA polymerase sigma factor (sigma-70 family)